MEKIADLNSEHFYGIDILLVYIINQKILGY